MKKAEKGEKDKNRGKGRSEMKKGDYRMKEEVRSEEDTRKQRKRRKD